MPIYLDTRGRSTLGIGICGRCSMKMSLEDLHPDPNAPGLMVCTDDLDRLDPYRLPARAQDRINLDNPRPDVSIADRGSVFQYCKAFFGLSEIKPANVWQPNTRYERGDSVTPVSVDVDTTTLPQSWFVCIVPGTSGATPPPWPIEAGTLVGIFNYMVDDQGPNVHAANVLTTDRGEALVSDPTNADGTACWLNLGIFPLGRTEQG